MSTFHKQNPYFLCNVNCQSFTLDFEFYETVYLIKLLPQNMMPMMYGCSYTAIPNLNLFEMLEETSLYLIIFKEIVIYLLHNKQDMYSTSVEIQ